MSVEPGFCKCRKRLLPGETLCPTCKRAARASRMRMVVAGIGVLTTAVPIALKVWQKVKSNA